MSLKKINDFMMKLTVLNVHVFKIVIRSAQHSANATLDANFRLQITCPLCGSSGNAGQFSAL